MESKTELTLEEKFFNSYEDKSLIDKNVGQIFNLDDLRIKVICFDNKTFNGRKVKVKPEKHITVAILSAKQDGKIVNFDQKLPPIIDFYPSQLVKDKYITDSVQVISRSTFPYHIDHFKLKDYLGFEIYAKHDNNKLSFWLKK